MLEKLAYWNVLLQMPIYIAQKDAPGGLHWDQAIKGVIFFIWAFFQNFVPIFSGGYTDKFGYKKSFILALILILGGYLLMGTQRELIPFIFGTVILGIGSGIFRPTIQASVSLSIGGGNETKAWGIYVMLINIAVVLSPPISKLLKEISWESVFWGSAGITLINLFIIFFYQKIPINSSKASVTASIVFKNILQNLFKKEIIWFLLFMSGFIIIYMQFYETLPNFILDWSDTSKIARDLNLPDFMLMTTAQSKMISYEWLYNLNAILVVLFVVVISILTKTSNRLKIISTGIILASLGLQICGLTREGYLLIAGIVVYTFGEMIVSPKFLEHLSSQANSWNKALYMGFLNLSYTIGLSVGALSGGFIYKHFGEKAYLASKYLDEYYGIKDINLTMSIDKLCSISNLDKIEVSNLLWRTYNPELIWLPFIIIGVISAIGLIIISRKKTK